MTAKSRSRVNRQIRKWQRRLLLDAWTIEVIFASTAHPIEEGREVYVTVSPDARYSSLHLTIWTDFWSLPEDKQSYRLLHELIHGPTTPLADLAVRAVRRKQAIAQDVEDAEERLVEHFTQALWRAYE